METGGPYRLVRSTLSAPRPPVLDTHQQVVVDHVAAAGSGPLLVLAGPGTGKTTTLVEAVAARVAAGTPADRVLTLTFSRKAAAELRDRIAARLGGTVAAQPAWTFHAFAYALAQQARPPEELLRPLRLLSAPEQDVVLRELLAGNREDVLDAGATASRVEWPADLHVALGTRGFADEVRALVSRARGLGLEPIDLARAGQQTGRADWVAAARFLDDYLAVLDDLGALDYSELIHRAVVHAETAEGGAALRNAYDLVVVDEYQDTDPAQERLLRAIAGDGRDLVVVGDPDQSIYAFRGAEVSNILEFPTRFPRRDGSPAAIAALRVSRRAGSTLLAASRQVGRRMPLPGRDAAPLAADHRALEPAAGMRPGSVEVLTFPTASTQLETIADLLRREHLDDGTPWVQMAVLVRSGQRSVPYLRRALGAAGIPVEVAGDELPLAREAAVAPLLAGLRVAAEPDELTADLARDLLLSPLGGLDVVSLRRLGRLLRDADRAAAPERQPRPSDDLLREALVDPALLDTVDETRLGAAGPDLVAARRLGALLARARAEVDAGAGPYSAMWLLWQGTPWPRRLEAAAGHGGPAGRSADRDLDAVVALFAAASRDEERTERRGVLDFLEALQAQQIPADALSERGTRAEGVRLLTAHRAKGLEWDVVVVCDVQEEGWPDIRYRGSLLQADRLGLEGPPPSASELLAEERRLFYVAVTRARRRLVVMAVDSPEDDGSRPSRFLGELGVEAAHITERPRRPLTLPDLVAELRVTLADESLTDGLRQAAARRLAQLAAARVGAPGRELPAYAAAAPELWWGVADDSAAPDVMRAIDDPIRLSGSSLDSLNTCGLRWFLSHEVRAEQARTTALGFGSIIHAVADGVARGEVAPDVGSIDARLDRVWGSLPFAAPWQSVRERDEARAVLRRFLAWHVRPGARTVVGSEVAFSAELTVAGRRVELRGSMDRVEVDADGAVVVVDLKTGKFMPTKKSMDEHVQLGVYQLAVVSGAIDAVLETHGVPTPPRSAGAELLFVRSDATGGDRATVHGVAMPAVRSQEPIPTDGTSHADAVLAHAVEVPSAEQFQPQLNQYCKMLHVPDRAARRSPSRRRWSHDRRAAGGGARRAASG